MHPIHTNGIFWNDPSVNWTTKLQFLPFLGTHKDRTVFDLDLAKSAT